MGEYALHGEALGPSGENFESRWSVNGNIGHFTPLFENDKNWNICEGPFWDMHKHCILLRLRIEKICENSSFSTFCKEF